MFLNKHILDRYSSFEIEYKRFDSNLQQALAWNHLKSGTFVSEDIEWLKHECAERHHELKYNAGYFESHNRAQTRFDVNPWENGWYNIIKIKFYNSLGDKMQFSKTNDIYKIIGAAKTIFWVSHFLKQMS